VPGQLVQLSMDGSPFDVFLPPMAMSDFMPVNASQPFVRFSDEGRRSIVMSMANDSVAVNLTTVMLDQMSLGAIDLFC
jgi:hypothetical protein